MNVSYFYKKNGIFGSYPTQSEVNEMERQGVKWFVDLTTKADGLSKYYCSNDSVYISYPIPDKMPPENTSSYCEFIDFLSSVISGLGDTEKMYIHCRGGHGRSGTVVASLLCILEGLNPETSINKTTYYHKLRPNLKTKWSRVFCPNAKSQRDFVRQLYGK
jgi:protein-tyrosine phosphatase